MHFRGELSPLTIDFGSDKPVYLSSLKTFKAAYYFSSSFSSFFLAYLRPLTGNDFLHSGRPV